MEYIPCPLCKSNKFKPLFQRLDHTHKISDDKFTIGRCKVCGLIFINPRPTPEEIHDYYPEDFYSVNLSADELLHETESRTAAKLALFQNLSPGRLLDIGCQKGEFLFEAKHRGWDVYGIEFSTKPPNLYNLPIYYGQIDNAPFEDGHFDLITMWAVLEHVHDPLSMLGQIKRLLSPSGRAIILIPNYNSIPARLMRHDDVPRHLIMFTPRTFKILSEKAGFRVNKIIFGDDIFSGSTRGSLNFIYKLFRGERHEEILAQNRDPERWIEFSNYILGQKSDFMLRIDRLDIKITPYLDRLMNWLKLGFIMTIEIQPD